MDLFPFEHVRDGQKEFMEDVRKCLEEGEHLVAHAPTGIGKTVATLVPSVEWALESDKTVFFATPRHSQHRIAIETVKLMEEGGQDVRAVDFIGKRWMCPEAKESVSSRDFSTYCKLSREDGLCDLYNATFTKGQPTSRAVNFAREYSTSHVEEFVAAARDFCPYYALMLAARKARVVICDYYHVFHESVRNSFLPRMNKSLDGSALVVDEAHNLPDRIRDLMSETLTDFSLSRALSEADEYAPYLKRDLKAISKVLAHLREGRVSKSDFLLDVEHAADANYSDLAEAFEKAARKVRERQERSALGGVASFLKGWLGEDHGFLRFVRKKRWRGKSFKELNYKCLDPADECKKVFEKLRTAVLMSGTLLPTQMYASVLGLEAKLKEYESPFPPENRLNLVVPTVTTRYKERGRRQYEKLAKHIAAVLEAAPGNSAVFFPSYALQQRIGGLLEGLTRKRLFWEDPDHGKKKRERLLKAFRTARIEGAALLGVVGGSFSEGVDYADNLLTSVVVVGLPLESPTLEVKALIDYYERKFGKGWDYGYIYPAMNRAMQSAGRMIRSSSDRGVVVFLDKRYEWSNYSKCFPQSFRLRSATSPALQVREFWRSQ